MPVCTGIFLVGMPGVKRDARLKEEIGMSFGQKRAEYGFGEYGFKHRTQ